MVDDPATPRKQLSDETAPRVGRPSSEPVAGDSAPVDHPHSASREGHQSSESIDTPGLTSAEGSTRPAPEPTFAWRTGDPQPSVSGEPAHATRRAAEPIRFPRRPGGAVAPSIEDRPLRAATGHVPPLDPHPFKLGILGGMESGKSYLFQGMVYRLYRGSLGPIAYFTKDEAISVYEAHTSHARGDSELSSFRALQIDDLVRDFKLWRRLPRTQFVDQRWYRLQVSFRSGWLGRRRSTIEVGFLDGSGEYLASGVTTEEDRSLWTNAFVDADVMIFCLPMWAAFPYAPSFKDKDWEEHDRQLTSLGNVVTTYRELRKEARVHRPVRIIVALTMADDLRCAHEVQRTWIDDYVKNADRYLKAFRKGRGIAQYLASARQVSQQLLKACDSISVDERVSNLRKMDFGYGMPWLVPMSALNGHQLQSVEQSGMSEADRRRLRPPVPVHVDLPPLIALSERYNALA